MKSRFIALLLLCTFVCNAQELSEPCKIRHGINLSGMADFITELAFVDLMRNSREWYTHDIGNPNAAFDSELADQLTYRSDGYPTEIPQSVNGSTFLQDLRTIWGITDGWPAGQYTVLWDGTGQINMWGTLQNVEQTGPNRIIFDFEQTVEGIIELTIAQSDVNDPIHNIRVLMPGTESTYATEPFNPLFIERVSEFSDVRFMGWGQTNNWGTNESNWTTAELWDWEERAHMSDPTWATSKGIPYEMMVKLMNDYDLNGWICVPHRASNDYIQNMAEYFRDNLEPELELTVEYSNEIWNWMFAQTQWLNLYGCENTGTSWPEGIVPYIQNCLDIWTTVYAGQEDRIRRVVGTQPGWTDIGYRIADNMTPGSFDAITPTHYFGFSDEADAALDALGASATVQDIRDWAWAGLQDTKMYLTEQKEDIADVFGVDIVTYEGGQHLTNHPFGVEPEWAPALLEMQRDSSLYNIYNALFEFMRTLQEGEEPLLSMEFALTGARSARYGSWGILETLDQDTTQIPAPKFAAIIDDIKACDNSEPPSDPEPPNTTPTDVRNFIFGHSLINHESVLNPQFGDETKVPYWLHDLAVEAGHTYAGGGQYGFLPQHDNLPPFAQWGWSNVPGVWDSDTETFAEADINTILLTAGNFMQWQASDEPYPGEDGVVSPLTATIDVMDWTESNTGDMRFYVYENWPDMAGFIAGQSFPPSASEFANYNNYTTGEFHDWWIEYQDFLISARPDIYPRMIPVGPVLTELLTLTPLSGISVTDLYEDNAPHGKPTIYFLASLVTYMGMYAEPAPVSFTIPASVHPLVETHFESTINYIWTYLQNFNDAQGNSRVFYPNAALPAELVSFIGEEKQEQIELNWTTRNEVNTDYFEVEYSYDNQEFNPVGTVNARGNSTEENNYMFPHREYRAGINYYRLRQTDRDGSFTYSEVISVAVPQDENAIVISPNPSSTGQVQVTFYAKTEGLSTITLYDVTGRILQETNFTPEADLNTLSIETAGYPEGVYLLQLRQGAFLRTEKLILR